VALKYLIHNHYNFHPAQNLALAVALQSMALVVALQSSALIVHHLHVNSILMSYTHDT
jgi:hypothetical protein